MTDRLQKLLDDLVVQTVRRDRASMPLELYERVASALGASDSDRRGFQNLIDLEIGHLDARFWEAYSKAVMTANHLPHTEEMANAFASLLRVARRWS